MSRQNARARIALGRFEAEAEIGPMGLLAVGALVSGILLSTAVIVRAKTAPPRLRLTGPVRDESGR